MNSILYIVGDLSSALPLVIGEILFLVPFLHEDIAIIAAALLVAQHHISVPARLRLHSPSSAWWPAISCSTAWAPLPGITRWPGAI